MAFSWTEDQQRAINASGGDVVVSAAAGAGKTAVLTARCLRLIQEGVSIDRLLVITFTDAAAHELRARIAGEFGDPRAPATDADAVSEIDRAAEPADHPEITGTVEYRAPRSVVKVSACRTRPEQCS